MKPHKFDTLSFVSGLIFTGFGLLFLIPASTEDLFDVFVDVGSWAWPLILLGIGLAILVPVFIGGREEPTEEAETLQSD
ncbi:MAG: hypothetical protein DWQ40_10385 [Actinobacteria bacterium]|nr:MAG: hypothetical protein DWQ40_10385 [Actinomycetota bacterium]